MKEYITTKSATFGCLPNTIIYCEAIAAKVAAGTARTGMKSPVCEDVYVQYKLACTSEAVEDNSSGRTFHAEF